MKPVLSFKAQQVLDLQSNDLAQLAVMQGRGITIDTHKFGCTPCRRTRNKVLQKPFFGCLQITGYDAVIS